MRIFGECSDRILVDTEQPSSFRKVRSKKAIVQQSPISYINVGRIVESVSKQSSQDWLHFGGSLEEQFHGRCKNLSKHTGKARLVKPARSSSSFAYLQFQGGR